MITEDERMRESFEKNGLDLCECPDGQYGVWKLSWQAALSAQPAPSSEDHLKKLAEFGEQNGLYPEFEKPATQEVEKVMNLVDVYTDDFYTVDRMALESAITAIVKDRDEWKEATESANERFKLADRKMVEAAPAAVPVAWRVSVNDSYKPPRLFLSIDNQSFAIDVEYVEHEPDRLDWYCNMLTKAMQRLTQPAEQVRSVEDDMMDLADRMAEDPERTKAIDQRAWQHLLVYSPAPQPAAQPVELSDDAVWIAALKNEIAHAEVNDLCLAPSFGRVDGDPAVRISSIRAIMDRIAADRAAQKDVK